jgi:hypothetical protein
MQLAQQRPQAAATIVPAIRLALLCQLVIFRCLSASEEMRDPLLQPFNRHSHWNMPIGTDAVYVHAQLKASQQYGLFAEEEHIILTPSAPLTKIFTSTADWKTNADRGYADGPLITELPIPRHYITEPRLGATPNAVATILQPDGMTLYHTQPFDRQSPGRPATSHYTFPTTDIYGDGLGGGHGGSQLSGIGGTIRLGQLVPGGRIPHTLKIVMNNKWLAYRNDSSPGYRWPALVADNYATTWTYKGQVPDLEMGALLALIPEFSIEQLQTEPGRILAQALQDYGAYLCDAAGWDAYYFGPPEQPRSGADHLMASATRTVEIAGPSIDANELQSVSG